MSCCDTAIFAIKQKIKEHAAVIREKRRSAATCQGDTRYQILADARELGDQVRGLHMALHSLQGRSPGTGESSYANPFTINVSQVVRNVDLCLKGDTSEILKKIEQDLTRWAKDFSPKDPLRGKLRKDLEQKFKAASNLIALAVRYGEAMISPSTVFTLSETPIEGNTITLNYDEYPGEEDPETKQVVLSLDTILDSSPEKIRVEREKREEEERKRKREAQRKERERRRERERLRDEQRVEAEKRELKRLLRKYPEEGCDGT